MIEIKNTFVPEEDLPLCKILKEKGDDYDESKALFAHMHLHRLTKTEDWFKDETTLVRTIRKGKGRNPYTDSTVKFRLQMVVNGKEVLSNYPKNAPLMKVLAADEEGKEEPSEYNLFESENMRRLTTEERVQYIEKAEGLFTVRLDTYTLPSLLIKILKSMKKNGAVEIQTSRIDKLKTNFANEDIGLDQYAEGLLNEGDDIKMQITLLDSTHPIYFYKLLVSEKLEHVLRLKGTAGKFFKSSLPNGFKKAADLYQKINGYYNFGDATNNYAK